MAAVARHCLLGSIWILAFALLKGAASSSSLDNGEHQRIVQRTSWPTETGTMVRILRSSNPSHNNHQRINSEDEIASGVRDDESYYQLASNYNPSFGKRNLFLRTSRRVQQQQQEEGGNEQDEEMGKRGAAAPKRNTKPKQESPIFFRTFRSAAAAPLRLQQLEEYY